MAVSLGIPLIRAAEPAPAEVPQDGPLVDRYGRAHRDLRISLTDRCSLRCTYCMPVTGVPWLPKDTLLTTDELVRVAEVSASLGIVEMRLTGGEPLLRPDVVTVVRRLAAIETEAGRMRVSITTNGLALPKMMDDLVDAGLERLNVSIDTLDREKYRDLTRRDRLDDALEGIRAARASGLRPLKLNAVAMRGVNDDELRDLLRFAVEHEAELRFIEQMPLDAGHTWRRDAMVEGEEILAELRREFSLERVAGRGASPAEVFAVDGGPATVGVIASVTAPFCGACDRVRLTADGQIRNCLFAREESDLRAVLRDEALDEPGRDAAIARIIRGSIAAKRPGHGIDEPGFLQPQRPMSAIGG
ncbi:GTP 3',8-cyclase MoaA [Gulosibacter sp. 10]|uniref:GTP 3',8-cyclase MoaA n=1 Tax=Gulosibacter sp. 10 TaxID=1255570 RepID=UPI00097F3212|nr:GTP 3',8-cyclase MoaA [Gulosibacter sp. 10]SJM70979.1 Molybdenum cofactor biosynthesis protein MoaA [Gulosibacter sp. 10]